MKSVLNFHMTRLSFEVVSFQWSEIRVANIYNLCGQRTFHAKLWAEKQWCTLRKLPGIAFLLKSRGGVCRTYMNENVGLCLDNLHGNLNRQTIKKLRRHLCV